MTVTALQKRCDGTNLPSTPQMIRTPFAAGQYGGSLSSPIASWEPQPNFKGGARPHEAAAAMNAHCRGCFFVVAAVTDNAVTSILFPVMSHKRIDMEGCSSTVRPSVDRLFSMLDQLDGVEGSS